MYMKWRFLFGNEQWQWTKREIFRLENITFTISIRYTNKFPNIRSIAQRTYKHYFVCTARNSKKRVIVKALKQKSIQIKIIPNIWRRDIFTSVRVRFHIKHIYRKILFDVPCDVRAVLVVWHDENKAIKYDATSVTKKTSCGRTIAYACAFNTWSNVKNRFYYLKFYSRIHRRWRAAAAATSSHCTKTVSYYSETILKWII